MDAAEGISEKSAGVLFSTPALFYSGLFLGDELFLPAHVGTEGDGNVDTAVCI